MQKLFNKILVPVDFSVKSKKAIEKAVEFAKDYQCSIHFLHVVSASPFATIGMADGHMTIPYVMIDNQNELEYRLKKFCHYASLISDHSIEAKYTILKGSWDEAIIDFVSNHSIDLVLIGQKGKAFKKRKMLLDPDKIARKTHVPVITIPANRRITKLYSVVIPVTEFLPVRKLMYGIYIASRYNTTIKLLAVESDKTEHTVQHYLKRSYQLIRDNCTIKTELETIKSNNVAEAVNQYARMQSADLVIVNPETQTKMPGFFSSLLGNIIQKYSSPPVLTVTPA